MPIETQSKKPKFSDSHIRNAKKADKPYKLTDGGRLYIEIRPTGTKLWRYRYKIGGKENVFALGDYAQDVPKGESEEEASMHRHAGLYTLLEARVDRERCSRFIKHSIHPARERKLENIRQANEANRRFEAVLREWLQARRWAASTKAKIRHRLPPESRREGACSFINPAQCWHDAAWRKTCEVPVCPC